MTKFRRPAPEAALAALWFPTAFLCLGVLVLASFQVGRSPEVAVLGLVIFGASLIATWRTSLSIGERDLAVCNGFRTVRVDARDIVRIDIGPMGAELFPRGVELVTKAGPLAVRAGQRFTQRRSQVLAKALEDYGYRNGVTVDVH